MAFESIKNKFQRDKAVRLLLALAALGQTGMFMSDKDIAILKHEPTFVEVNEALKDDKGNTAIRASVIGSQAAATLQTQAASQPQAAAAPKQEFTIDAGVPLPVAQRGGPRGNVYPFDKLEIGQSFFVAATEAKPTPAKSLASTVSSATRRYKDAVPARKFTIRAVEGGARIWRTA